MGESTGSLGRWHVLWFQPFICKNPWVHDLPFVIKFLICKIWVIITVRVRADSEVLQTVPSNSKHSINIGYYSSKFMYFNLSVMSLCDPMDCSTPGFPVHHQLRELAPTHVHQVSDAIEHLILCCPLLLLPPIPPSIRVFSSESRTSLHEVTKVLAFQL